MTGAAVNQDCYFIKEDLAGIRGNSFVGVCDGHGSAGHFLSQHVSLSLSSRTCSNFRLLYCPSQRLPRVKQILPNSEELSQFD